MVKQPAIARCDNDTSLQDIPFIGGGHPKGWHKADEFFVDSSGWGKPGEWALTLDQFFALTKAGYGYAVTKAGQFQVYVGVFILKKVKL